MTKLIHIHVADEPKLDLVGMREVAEMAGVERSTLRAWKTRGKLPEPAAVLAMGPVWHRSQIEAWLAYRAEVGLGQADAV